MKRILTSLMALVVALGLAFGTAVRPVYADDDDGKPSKPKMNVLNMCNDKKEGEDTIKCVLGLVVTVMTYGIGVLGVVGIVLSGIQYITSQGDPAKMAKAKNRIVHVIIGLVVYAVMYAALVFLVPGFNPGL